MVSNKTLNILLVDDDPEIAQAVVNYLPPEQYRVEVVGDGADVMPVMRQFTPDVVLLDVNLPSMSGLELLRLIKDESPRVPVIIVSGYVSTGNAIDAMKEGAFDYLTKPFRLQKLERTIARAVGQLPEQTVMADDDVPLTDDQIIGKSPEIVEVAKVIGQVAQTDAPVLVIGETGTGKELVARVVHRNSNRRNKPFVTINCASTSEEILEAELFGQGPGGAGSGQGARVGRFEQANGGTVFLDEVSDLSIHAQSKLLGILQEGMFQRLNDDQMVNVDVRIVAATNRSLVDLMKEGQFRVDLFYRLKVISLFLPPLRERRSDIELLADFYIKKYSRKTGRPVKQLSPNALERLTKHHWPGNIRELENAIHTAVVLSKENELLPEDFPMVGGTAPTFNADLDNMRDNYRSLFKNVIDSVFDKMLTNSEGRIHNILTDALEQSLVEAALEATDNNQVRAAQLLGISRNTLRERMRRFDLSSVAAMDESIRIHA